MKIAMYFHAGSKNHGCEAIVRSTVKMIGDKECKLYSIRKEEDLLYGLETCCDIEEDWLSRKKLLKWIFLSIFVKLRLINKTAKSHYSILHSNEEIALSIGGDNYCYKGQPKQLGFINRRLKKQGKKTILWGCSIEPNLLADKKISKDLKRYDLIITRESITKEALAKVGICKNVKQYADPAFHLESIKLPLPDGFIEGNTIGINVSPLIMKYESDKGATMKNYQNLILYILEQTDYQVAFIPHVVGKGDDDREPLRELMQPHIENNRVVFIDDHNCMELKGYISCCRMFVGARTHATIAAYSSGVPTLVVGYSIKARGIAKDLFGTEEHYVLPVQKLKKEDDLVTAFQWLEENEDEIVQIYKNKLPDYILSAKQATEII